MITLGKAARKLLLQGFGSAHPACCLSLFVLFLLVCAYLGQSRQATAQAEAGKPNVLLIIADDLGVRLGCYGFPVSTPNIDRLAQMGRLFGNAYCQYPLCNPSRASLMSGWQPDRTGVWTNRQNERVPGAVWLQEWFRSYGYRTARFGKVFHHPQYFTNWTYQSDSQDSAFSCLESGTWWCSQNIGDAQTRDGKNARKAAAWIEQNRSASWLCCIGFSRPHIMNAPSSYYALYDPAAIQLSSDPANDLDDVPPEAYGENPPLVMSDGDARFIKRAYYAATSLMDAQVGVLLAKLDQWQLWNRTIVVVIGDHGFLLGDHSGIWGSRVLFDWATRVPLIVAASGQQYPGVMTSSYAELAGLFPTLTDLCGLPTPADLARSSLRPAIIDPQAAGYIEVLAFLRVGEFGLSRSTVSDAMRFTQWSQGGLELYDLIADPRENMNLLAGHLPAQ